MYKVPSFGKCLRHMCQWKQPWESGVANKVFVCDSKLTYDPNSSTAHSNSCWSSLRVFGKGRELLNRHINPLHTFMSKHSFTHSITPYTAFLTFSGASASNKQTNKKQKWRNELNSATQSMIRHNSTMHLQKISSFAAVAFQWTCQSQKQSAWTYKQFAGNWSSSWSIQMGDRKIIPRYVSSIICVDFVLN